MSYVGLVVAIVAAFWLGLTCSIHGCRHVKISRFVELLIVPYLSQRKLPRIINEIVFNSVYQVELCDDIKLWQTRVSRGRRIIWPPMYPVTHEYNLLLKRWERRITTTVKSLPENSVHYNIGYFWVMATLMVQQGRRRECTSQGWKYVSGDSPM